MWVQWSKGRHLSSRVLLYGDSNNSFWYFSSWFHFWARAWTCVLGRGRIEQRQGCQARQMMDEGKVVLVPDRIHSAWPSVGIWKCRACVGFFRAVKVSPSTNKMRILLTIRYFQETQIIWPSLLRVSIQKRFPWLSGRPWWYVGWWWCEHLF